MSCLWILDPTYPDLSEMMIITLELVASQGCGDAEPWTLEISDVQFRVQGFLGKIRDDDHITLELVASQGCGDAEPWTLEISDVQFRV